MVRTSQITWRTCLLRLLPAGCRFSNTSLTRTRERAILPVQCPSRLWLLPYRNTVDMQKRVVVYTPEPASGAARYVLELVKSVAQAGTSVLLFCPSNFAYAAELATYGISVSYSAARGTEPGSLAKRISRNLR